MIFLLILFFASSSNAMQDPNKPIKHKLTKESIQKIKAHKKHLRELQEKAIEKGDLKKSAEISEAIILFLDGAYGRKNPNIMQAHHWEL